MLLLALMALFVAGCTDNISTANDLVQDSETQRLAATDKLRRSTASIESLVRSAAAGQTLPASQTLNTAAGAKDDLNSGLEELAGRDDNLSQAQALQLNDRYQEYLDLLKQSNVKLTDTLNKAMAIPQLIENEQIPLAGWDEARAKQVVVQIQSLQVDIDRLYNESELLRNQAEQLRRDNPEEFGE